LCCQGPSSPEIPDEEPQQLPDLTLLAPEGRLEAHAAAADADATVLGAPAAMRRAGSGGLDDGGGILPALPVARAAPGSLAALGVVKQEPGGTDQEPQQQQQQQQHPLRKVKIKIKEQHKMQSLVSLLQMAQHEQLPTLPAAAATGKQGSSSNQPSPQKMLQQQQQPSRAQTGKRQHEQPNGSAGAVAAVSTAAPSAAPSRAVSADLTVTDLQAIHELLTDRTLLALFTPLDTAAKASGTGFGGSSVLASSQATVKSAAGRQQQQQQQQQQQHSWKPPVARHLQSPPSALAAFAAAAAAAAEEDSDGMLYDYQEAAVDGNGPRGDTTGEDAMQH